MRATVVCLVLVVLPALASAFMCMMAALPIGTGQAMTPDYSDDLFVVDGTSLVIGCASGYVSSGVTSASYLCSSGTWTSTSTAVSTDVVCTTSCVADTGFDAGFGGCSTYNKASGLNYNYCSEDFDSTMSVFAYAVCTECEQCNTGSNTASASTTTTVTTDTREGSSTVMAFGGCYCRSDSSLSCSSNGVCEIDTSSDARCGYQSLPYTTPVTWDMCSLSTANACIDRYSRWTDSGGTNCREYGMNYCLSRSNKATSDLVGKVASDTFATYADTDGYDASEVCCMCGGGTQKCLEEDMSATSRLPWKFDYSACGGVQVGSTCAVSCLGESTTTSVSCQRESVFGYDANSPWETQAVLGTFPTCPETYDSWGLKSNGKCAGTAARTTSATNWKSCVSQASADCNVALSWDSVTNTCYEYASGQCDTVTATTGYYSFEFVGPTPAFAPSIASVQVVSSRGSTHHSAYVQDTANCNTATVDYTWFYQLEWTDGTTTSTGSVVASVTASNMYVTMLSNPDPGQSWSVKAAAYTVHAGDNTVSSLGPWSESFAFTT